ncbi:MAG: hydrogenase 3 maturation endopeptidase HyCI [Thermoproteota archaeon]
MEENTNHQLEEELKSWFSGYRQVVIAGIGNPLRKDDFVGMRIVQHLKNCVPPCVHLIECETVPESFIQSIVELNPSHVLIIDAAKVKLKPADSKLVYPQELLEYSAISTHSLPLRIFCQYLTQTTEADIALLVIQPEDSSFGENLTGNVKKTAKNLSEILCEILEKREK